MSTMHMSWLFVALSVSLKSKILAKSRSLNRGAIFDLRNRATKGFLRSWGVAAGPLARSLVARSLSTPLSRQGHLDSTTRSTRSLSLPSLPSVKTAIIIMHGHASNANRCRNQLVAQCSPRGHAVRKWEVEASAALVHRARHRHPLRAFPNRFLRGFHLPSFFCHPKNFYSFPNPSAGVGKWEVSISGRFGRWCRSGSECASPRVPYRSALLQSVRRDAPVRMRSAV